MFRTYQKNDFAYFVSLIFLVFPILGVFGGYYPVWTLVLTGLFTIAYLLIVYLKKAYSKWIPFHGEQVGAVAKGRHIDGVPG